MSDTVLACRILSCPCSPDATIGEPVNGHWRLTAKAQLVHLQGNNRPYFSVTGQVAYNRGEPHMYGCLHDEILHYFPELAPVVKVHLADDRGRPMHAVENAMYWAGLSVWAQGKPMAPDGDYGRRTLETDAEGLVWAPKQLADHLRISEDKARELRAYVISAGGSEREGWAFVIRDLEAQWQREADEALAVIRSARPSRRGW